ncbi:MAG: glycosyltransferase family 4 protein [Planctomycetes bacterium]|nr:glycosyltransferase family 4 protein [Planctomycetota bacterium]
MTHPDRALQSTPMTPRGSSAAAAAPLRVHTVYPYPCGLSGIAGIVIEFCDAVDRAPELRRRFECTAWVAYANRQLSRHYLRGTSRKWLVRLASRLPGGEAWLRRQTMRRIGQHVRPGDVCILYPGPTAPDLAALRAKGVTLVHDPVNTAYPANFVAFRRAYAAAGMPLSIREDAVAIADERARLSSQDVVIACSPHVQQSYEALGVSSDRIVRSSYGFSPHTFHPVRRAASKPTFLFAGTGSVRKGLPVLLKAWSRAGVDGRLVVLGQIDAEVAAHCAEHMRQSNIEFRDYTDDLGSVFGEADVFVLPSFEEGSPLVGYLALAAGLPCVMSPAAAGWVVRDGSEGFVVEPDDVESIARSLRRLADDPALRGRMAAAAAARSVDYTWSRVTQQRLAALAPFLPR